MENEIQKGFDFIDVGTTSMKDLEILVEKAKLAEGYLLTLTTKNKERLEHEFISYHFDKVDMLPSLKNVKNLIVQELEK